MNLLRSCALASVGLLAFYASLPQSYAQSTNEASAVESTQAAPPSVELSTQKVLDILAQGEQSEAEALLAIASNSSSAPPEIAFLNSACLRSRFLVRDAMLGWVRTFQQAPETAQGQAAACILGQDLATNLPTQLYYFSGLMVVARNHPNDTMIQWMAAVMARQLTRDLDSPMTPATRQRIVAYGIEQYRSVLAQFAPGVGPTLVHQTLANLLSAMGDNSTALEHYRIVMEREPRAWSLHAAATSLRDLFQWDEALHLADAALVADPTHEGAQVIRGECLWALDRGEEALALWIARIPGYSAGNCTYYGKLALAAGYPAQARIFLEKAVQLDPKDQVAPVYLARLDVHDGVPGASAVLAQKGAIDWRGYHTNSVLADEDNQPWFTAIETGDISTVRELLASNPIDCRNKELQETALMIAARCGWTELFPVLLDAGAQLDALDINDDTALHYAAQFEQHACVQQLLDAGANPNVLDKWGQSPISMAVSQYQWKTARPLINHPGIDLNLCAKNRGTALHAAAGYGQTDMIRTLLDHHADVNCPNPKNGTTPLMMTCTQYHHPDALAVLLDAGAAVNQQDLQGRTALRLAIQPTPAPQLTDTLLRHGADPLVADQFGVTPLAAAHLLGYGELAARMESALPAPAPDLPWNLPMLARPADTTTTEALRNAFTLPIALIYGLPLEPARALTPQKANEKARATLNTHFAITDAESFKTALIAIDRLLSLNHPNKLATRIDQQYPQFAAQLDHAVGDVFYLGKPANASPLAWRKSHLIYLARLGATAGYLSTDEAEEICATATETLRGTFTSWAEFTDSFIFGTVEYAGWELPRYEHICQLLLHCSPSISPWDNSIWRATPITPPPIPQGGATGLAPLASTVRLDPRTLFSE